MRATILALSLPAVLFLGHVAHAVPTSTASLANALEDWITLLEKDDAKAAARWAKDDTSARQMADLWDRLKAAHKQFNYRNWIDRAAAIGDGRTFKVGGHGVGHLHVDWEETDQGWRVAKAWICR